MLGRQVSFWVSAGVVAHTLWTSAAPAMTYRLYAEEWHLTHTVTTGIFAIYPIVVVTILIIFGDISDHIGRRTTMLVGLGASLIGRSCSLSRRTYYGSSLVVPSWALVSA